MIKNVVESIVRHSPAFVVKVAARSFNRLPRGTSLAHFIADRARIPACQGAARISSDPPLFLEDDGSTIVKVSYFIGEDAYEPGEARVWRNLCAASSNVLEIGGNIGFFTVIGAAATRGFYRVVEPHPFSADSLRANIKRNCLTNVEIIEAAVVGHRGPGTITLHIPLRQTGKRATGAYIDGAEGIDRPSTERFDVTTVDGATLSNEMDLLKLDVEGAEYEILLAMEEGVSRCKPVIVLEVRRRTPQLRAWIRRFCQANSYEIWALNKRPVQMKVCDIETVVLQEVYGTRDVILVPSERKQRVQSILVEQAEIE
jgi:FkbM family methyltransferase